MTEKRGGKALAREKQPVGFVWLLKPSHTLRMKWIKALLFIPEPHRCADKLRTPAPNEGPYCRIRKWRRIPQSSDLSFLITQASSSSWREGR